MNSKELKCKAPAFHPSDKHCAFTPSSDVVRELHELQEALARPLRGIRPAKNGLLLHAVVAIGPALSACRQFSDINALHREFMILA
jgi:hypothetical protein